MNQQITSITSQEGEGRCSKGRIFGFRSLRIVPSPHVAHAQVATYQEPFRPQYHYTPAMNWMNDPNGRGLSRRTPYVLPVQPIRKRVGFHHFLGACR
jgi:hypothetical protein